MALAILFGSGSEAIWQKWKREQAPLRRELPDARQRLAVFANIFSFGDPERYEFETVFCPVLVTHARGKLERPGSEGNLQVNHVADFQLGTGRHAGAAFRKINTSTLNVVGHIPFCNTNPDVLVELKPWKASIGGNRQLVQANTR
jgi:hypothetical protein